MKTLPALSTEVVIWKGAEPAKQWPNQRTVSNVSLVALNIGFFFFKVDFKPVILVNLAIRMIPLIQDIRSGRRLEAALSVVACALSPVYYCRLAAAIFDIFLEVINYTDQIKPIVAVLMPRKTMLDPTVFQNACKILGVPLKKADDQEFVEKKYRINRQGWLEREFSKNATKALKENFHNLVEYTDKAFLTLSARWDK